MNSEREIAFDLLRRLLAGERGRLPFHLAMLLQRSSRLDSDDDDDYYRQVLPPELAVLRLSRETVEEVVTIICAEVARTPDKALILAISYTGLTLAVNTLATVLANPPRPLTLDEVDAALAPVSRDLPWELDEDLEVLPKADLERLLQLAKDFQDLEESGPDGVSRKGRRHHAVNLLESLEKLGIGGSYPPPKYAPRRRRVAALGGLSPATNHAKLPSTDPAREIAMDMLRRLMAGGPRELSYYLAKLLASSAPLHGGDDIIREHLPPELADVWLSQETCGEIIATLCEEISRNPNGDLIAAMSLAGADLATKTVAMVVVNPPRPLAFSEYIYALMLLGRCLPYELAEDPGFLPKADLERLVQSLKELSNLEESGPDRGYQFHAKHYARSLLRRLAQLGIRGS